jgi:nitroreductase/dihydropteridine reductase
MGTIDIAEIVRIVTTRRTCKAFDPSKKIDPAKVEALLTVLRYAPSSVNSQPWHFVIASTDEGKAKVAEATQDGYAYNDPKVRNASHVVVFCARTNIDDAHLATVLDQEDRDGRFVSPEAKTGQNTSRTFYANLHRQELNDAPAWMEKQIYLALGTLLQAAAALEIDACPMEGFDQKLLDQALGLKERGLTAVVLTALGYGSETDFNAKLPKSRLGNEALFTHL